MEGYSNRAMSNNDSAGVPLTNEQLIDKAVSTPGSHNKTDALLLKVLSAHIVKLNPSSTAVGDAVREIEALAEKRAE